MNVLVIGSGGAIGKAIIDELLTVFTDAQVFAVSRAKGGYEDRRVTPVVLETSDEARILDWVTQCKAQARVFHHVICATGVLHDAQVQPEKRLEDLSAHALHHYFAVNTVLPMLWLKHLVALFPAEHSTFTVLSARVGSIADNGLGGWYGYRASKAALNMLVKTAAVEYKRRAKHTALICYHPGTVDSALSAPFQRNVKPEKLFPPAFTARQLIALIQQPQTDESPRFIDWAGKPVPW